VEPVARTQRHSGEAGASEGKGEPPQRVRVSLAAVRALQAAVAASPDERLQAAVRALTRVAASEIAVRVEGAVLAVAAAWGRQVRLLSSGAKVELDVAAADALAEPLVHLVRNALDHGIEAPGERLRLGKDPRGTLHLDFVERLDTIQVRFTDDGAGIDADRVAAVALAQGVADARSIAAMSPEQRMQLVFAPGVSTASPGGRSGRGVGLDVVRDVVLRLGGSVHVTSTAGIGTTFVLELPLA
jgi:two-component system chemotaxis sensor kinase CheA